MVPQTFQPADLGVVLFLVLLEGLLSADNALVLAIMVRHLPRDQQKRALLYGLGGAFVFRAAAIVLAAKIIALWWTQILGATYLLYLPVKHFVRHSREGKGRELPQSGFWATVFAVEVADIAFAVDSVLAAVAMVNLVKYPEKTWVVYFGAIIGVVLLRFAAGLFVGLLERYPKLDHVAYLLVGWVGVKLAMMGAHNYVLASGASNLLGVKPPEMPPVVFWTVLFLICLVGGILAFRDPETGSPDADGDPVD